MKDIVWTAMVVVIMLLSIGMVRHSMRLETEAKPQEAKAKVATDHPVAAPHPEAVAKSKASPAPTSTTNSGNGQSAKNDRPQVDAKQEASLPTENREKPAKQKVAAQINRESLEKFKKHQSQIDASSFDDSPSAASDSEPLDPGQLYSRLQRMTEGQ